VKATKRHKIIAPGLVSFLDIEGLLCFPAIIFHVHEILQSLLLVGPLELRYFGTEILHQLDQNVARECMLEPKQESILNTFGKA
jgi:hypothetical protein